MMTTRTKLTLLAGVILLAGSAASARASWTASFDSPSLSLTPNNGTNSSNAIALYLDSVVGCIGCVTVSPGAAVAQQYNGDGHVVGPNGNSLTLGNSNGATNNTNGGVNPPAYTTDYYISNTSASATGTSPDQLSSGIVIDFSAGHALTGTFSFDFQIFPDGSCPDLSGTDCGTLANPTANLPDLNFVANAGAVTQVNTAWLGAAPGGMTNGASTHSPASGMGTEMAPQLIGTSGPITLTGVTELQFNDWPATIGVDNLKLTSTPEPKGGAFLLGALALALIAGNKLRRTPVKS